MDGLLSGRMKSTLSSLSNYIEKFLDDQFPAYRSIVLKAVESMPKNPTREKTVLSEDQANKLLDYFSKSENPYNIQISCWLALALPTVWTGLVMYL